MVAKIFILISLEDECNYDSLLVAPGGGKYGSALVAAAGSYHGSDLVPRTPGSKGNPDCIALPTIRRNRGMAAVAPLWGPMSPSSAANLLVVAPVT
ncbi:hypothetical protein QE152_g15469 [Popillia japonica]|uniref:Uncharacterized protein n=1 Tax=Popillia japonica TaxID=7064 RepID=A0AAW1L7Q1_POPJA